MRKVTGNVEDSFMSGRLPMPRRQGRHNGIMPTPAIVFLCTLAGLAIVFAAVALLMRAYKQREFAPSLNVMYLCVCVVVHFSMLGLRVKKHDINV